MVTSLRNEERPQSWFSNNKPIEKNSRKKRALNMPKPSEETTILKIAPEMQRSSDGQKKIKGREKIRAKLFLQQSPMLSLAKFRIR